MFAAALGAVDGEPQAVRRDGRADLGQPAERLGDEAADAVDVVVLDLESEQLAELVDRQPGRHPVAALADLLHELDLVVVLVGDVADELLDEVLERDQARDAAVLVDHHRQVVGLAAASGAAAASAFFDSGTNSAGRARSPIVTSSAPSGLSKLSFADIPQVEDADHLVRVAVDHGHAGDALAEEQAHRRAESGAAIDR